MATIEGLARLPITPSTPTIPPNTRPKTYVSVSLGKIKPIHTKPTLTCLKTLRDPSGKPSTDTSE